ncbi:MAG: hypothetical protein AAB428_03475 [Patescibacteria group bacterium]
MISFFKFLGINPDCVGASFCPTEEIPITINDPLGVMPADKGWILEVHPEDKSLAVSYFPKNERSSPPAKVKPQKVFFNNILLGHPPMITIPAR